MSFEPTSLPAEAAPGASNSGPAAGKPGLVYYAPILLAAFLLVSGNGIVAVLLPYRGHLEGMSEGVIAWFGTGYFGGMLAGAFLVPVVIRAVGSRWAFVAFAAMGSAAAFYLPWNISPLNWFICRSIIGLSLSALYIALEAWQNATVAGTARAFLLSVGSTIQYGAWTTGSQIFAQSVPTSPWLFVISGGLMAASTLPLLLNRIAEPPRPARAKLDLFWFFRTAPVAFFGAGFIGLSNGAFWSLNPVYGAQIHLNAMQIGNLVTAVTVGSALAQVPFGRLSDHVDRRKVIVGLGLAAAAGNFILAGAGAGLPPVWLYAGFFVTAGLMMPTYYVVTAHAVDMCGANQSVMAGAAILLLYCGGAMIGPLVASALSGVFGPGALYGWSGTMYVLVAICTLLFGFRTRLAR